MGFASAVLNVVKVDSARFSVAQNTILYYHYHASEESVGSTMEEQAELQLLEQRLQQTNQLAGRMAGSSSRDLQHNDQE